jgi:hypothetical protein
MPEKNPNTDRWGGPGSSQQDRSDPEPHKGDPRSPGEPTNTRFSHVSGGGGERDRHHGHDAKAKDDSEENSRQRAKP